MRISGITQWRPSEMLAIEQVIDYVHHHVKDNINAQDLSVLFSISIKKLYIGIKTKTGMTLRDYHEKVKIDQAKLLLADREIPVKDVFSQLGYKTQSHFGQVFKENTGITPIEYRFKDVI
jgi:two-component system response regulator YesN